MAKASAHAFKRFCGHRTLNGYLVRKGSLIFLVGESDMARCMYNHTREF